MHPGVGGRELGCRLSYAHLPLGAMGAACSALLEQAEPSDRSLQPEDVLGQGGPGVTDGAPTVGEPWGMGGGGGQESGLSV